MKAFFSMLLCSSLAVSSMVVAVRGRQSSSQNQRDDKIVIRANEVMVDVVVRDKKGRPVTGLTTADCQILEDGVPQQIQSFREVRREVPAPAVEVGKPAAANRVQPVPAPSVGARDPFAGVSVIAMVFDRLSPNARALARRAALSYINEAMKPDDLAGVFAVDLSLHIIQTYTNNTELLKPAIERAASQSAQAFASNADAIRDMTSRQESLENQQGAAQGAAAAAAGPGGGPASGAAGQQVGAGAAEAALNRMALLAAEMYETIERNEQGYSTAYALLSIVNSLREVPGRKAVVFFSEGLVIPPAVESPFRAVISAANRANVSFYPVDAAGLRTEDLMTNSAREFNTIARSRSRQAASGRDDTSGRPMSRDLERNEDLLRLDPHSGLGMLADQTGGFLVSDTNDLGQGVRRIDEDMRVHYELTYVPKNQEYDGKFRTIAVKVDRPGLEVQARKGYYAVDVSTASPILAYEAPALAAIGRARNANPAFQLRLKGFNFPEATREGLVTVLVEAPARGFTYAIDKDKKQYASDFSIVVVVKSESGQVVNKLSHHYVLTGAADKVNDATKGDILFFREAQLPSGKYTIETIAYDAPTAKSAIKTASVEVLSPGDDRLRLSSVVMLRSAERLSEADKKVDNPFHLGEVLVYPNLGESIKKSASKQLACYFTVYVSKSNTSAPKLSIEIARSQKAMVKVDPALPAPDQSGRIQYANAFPLDAFPPGEYELKVTVNDGKDSVTRSETFSVTQ
jgi:VWFA-related protein